MAAGRIYRNRWIVLTHSQGMPVTSDDISIYIDISNAIEKRSCDEMAEKSTVYIKKPAMNIDEINTRTGRSFRGNR